MRHRSLSEAALTGHPLGILYEDFAPPNLGRRNRSRYWWPLALNQTQEHVDAIGVETPPTFVVWWVAMAATIRPPCLVQIRLDACCFRLADVNMLFVEILKEMTRHSNTLA
jgi:hypothetical protein